VDAWVIFHNSKDKLVWFFQIYPIKRVTSGVLDSYSSLEKRDEKKFIDFLKRAIFK
jgi:hypothetical protein